MIDLVGLLAAVSGFLVLAASPGPATLAAATVSMNVGRSEGMRFGAGLSLGLAFWGAIAATGLGAVLQASSVALMILKLCGGAYLLWLAYGAFRSAGQKRAQTSVTRRAGTWFRRGLMLNLSNPKAVVAWMATLSLGISADNTPTQVITATALCAALGFPVYAGYVVLFSTRRVMQVYSRLRRWIEGAVGVFFSVAGIGLIRSALAR